VLFPVVATLLLALGILAACLRRPAPTPRHQRRAEQRSAERAAEVAAALDLIADQDPEIPTTHHLRSRDGADDLVLSMGSPALVRGLRLEHVDWMTLRAAGDPRLPDGTRLRPPMRTVFDWRDGAPGEAPTLVTPGGIPLVVEGHVHDEDIAALVTWVDALPEGVLLVERSREKIELRAGGAAVEDAHEAAQRLLALVRRACG
jgi:hypothetical protein